MMSKLAVYQRPALTITVYCNMINSDKLDFMGASSANVQSDHLTTYRDTAGVDLKNLYYNEESKLKTSSPILELKSITKEYNASRGGKMLPILQNVNISI